jgi:hypothetical protein
MDRAEQVEIWQIGRVGMRPAISRGRTRRIGKAPSIQHVVDLLTAG